MPITEARLETIKGSALESVLLTLGPVDAWEEKNGSWWITLVSLSTREMTLKMLAHKARFVTITAIELPDHEMRMDYHWDFEGQLLTITTEAVGKQMDGISDICPAADWAEREIHEYFAVDFSGRVDTRPLMLRVGDTVGINLHEGGAK